MPWAEGGRGGRPKFTPELNAGISEYGDLDISFSLTLVLSLHGSVPAWTQLFLGLGKLPLYSGMRLSCQIRVGPASVPYSEVHGWVTPAFSAYQLDSELGMSLGEQWVPGLKQSFGELPSFCLRERRIFTLDNLTGLLPLRIWNRLICEPRDRELWLTADLPQCSRAAAQMHFMLRPMLSYFESPTK